MFSKKIVEHLEANDLISASQSGFLSSRSTLSQLLLSQFMLVDNINSRSCIDGIYTDLSKAFDSISHTKLLIKLYTYGINLYMCKRIENIPCYRCQHVIINDSVSGWQNY